MDPYSAWTLPLKSFVLPDDQFLKLWKPLKNKVLKYIFSFNVLFEKQFLSTFIDYLVSSYRFVEDLLIAAGVFNLLLTRLFETVTTSEKNRRGKSLKIIRS